MMITVNEDGLVPSRTKLDLCISWFCLFVEQQRSTIFSAIKLTILSKANQEIQDGGEIAV